MAILFYIVLLLIITAIFLFYYLQRYIVYEQDGLRLALPFLEGEQTSAPSQEAPPPMGPMDVVIVTPDFSNIRTQAGASARPLHALLITADNSTAAKLPVQLARLESEELQAVIMEVKPPKGGLVYNSEVGLAISFGTNGTAELRETVSDLKEQGVYLAAVISVCEDELMSTRNSALALRSADGSPKIADGGWLDPYNRSVGDYITEIVTELAAMGFDEIILSGLSHPPASDVQYSQSMATERDNVAAISNLALRLTDAARALDLAALRVTAAPEASETPYATATPAPEDGTSGITEPARELIVSVLMDADTFRSGAQVPTTGVDPELFYKIFDRVFIYTDAEHYEGDLDIASGVFGSASASRFVPFVYNKQSVGSYALR